MATAASHVLTKGDSPGASPAGKIRIYCNLSGILMRVDAMGNEIPVGGTEDADMESSVYDPQEIQDDAFARGNHTGQQMGNTIFQEANYRFCTDTEKSNWNSKEPEFSKNSAFNKDFGTDAGEVAEGNHDHDGVYEPEFSKNSAFNRNFGGSGSAITVSRSDHDHNGTYEPEFSKNSAFNKDFGTSAGEVSEGNHDHDGVYEPEFSKNSAFNKDFGTDNTEVARGDHGHFGLNVIQLDGISTLMMPDAVRSKNLSIAEIELLYSDNSISNNEWLKVARATDADSGYIMPHDGTIVAVTGFCENANNRAQYYRLYINGTQTVANFCEFPAGTGNQQFELTDKDVNFSRGDRIRVRAGSNGTTYDTNISLFVKWRS